MKDGTRGGDTSRDDVEPESVPLGMEVGGLQGGQDQTCVPGTHQTPESDTDQDQDAVGLEEGAEDNRYSEPEQTSEQHWVSHEVVGPLGWAVERKLHTFACVIANIRSVKQYAGNNADNCRDEHPPPGDVPLAAERVQLAPPEGSRAKRERQEDGISEEIHPTLGPPVEQTLGPALLGPHSHHQHNHRGSEPGHDNSRRSIATRNPVKQECKAAECVDRQTDVHPCLLRHGYSHPLVKVRTTTRTGSHG